MSIHLCIDVDLTIIDEKGNLKPGVQEFLEDMSHEQDRVLTLWSAAGKEYAHSVAKRLKLVPYFQSFASKPDIYVDDASACLERAIAVRVHEGISWLSVANLVRRGTETLDRMEAWYGKLPEFIRRIGDECDPVLARATTLVWANRNRFVHWPKVNELMWKGCRRKNEHSNPRCYTYPPDLVARLRERGIDKPDCRSNGPAIMAFLCAGGSRPQRRDLNWGWTIHHIYDGRFPAPRCGSSLHATRKGDHFTNSAGLVAVHPIADGLAGECAYFAWLLRFESFLRFGYDPDGVFSGAS